MRRFVYEEPVSRPAIWSRRLVLFALAVIVVSVLTLRLGEKTVQAFTPLLTGFLIAGLGMIVAVLAFVRIWVRGQRGVTMAVQAFVLGCLVMVPLAYMAVLLVRLPMLNDVSTDIDDPPVFARSRAVLAARAGRVPPDQTPETRKSQRGAYPQVLPVILDVPPEEAFDLARRTAILLRWQVIEMTPPGGRSGIGRIEAIDVTRIMRFSDDITIRIRPRADGSRIDIRSASRLGKHDLGANAARIARFIDEINGLAGGK
jgi:uncharacterized protein (DUF1499 family)